MAHAYPTADGVTPAQRAVRLLGCVAGIMGCFLVYGLLQETIMTKQYLPGERFTNSAFLVLMNRLVAIAIALALIYWRGEAVAPTAPMINYAAVSLSNFIATYCQYDALKYVSFPTQTLGKCGKMIPVLIIGSLIYRKAYTWRDYMVAVGVMSGCMLFVMTGDITGNANNKSDSAYGLALLLVYLTADGFTSTLQERLFEKKSSQYNQMLYVNLVSAGFSLVALVPDGSIWNAISYAQRAPSMFIDSIMLSASAALGQIVILYTIRTFGALMFSTIMTIRQFLSLLLSSVFFLHPLSMGQWAGATVVFGALYYKEALLKKSPDPKKASTNEHTTSASSMEVSPHDRDDPLPPYSSGAGAEPVKSAV